MQATYLTETYGLADRHRTMLEIESGISPEVIAQRGYFTATGPDELSEWGFAEYQIRTPALVIPVWGVDGQFRFARIRPDDPRQDRGKPEKVNKYEQPDGKPLVLDVPRATQPHLGDPTNRLWIVEGEKKADALVSRGECAVALLGVWAWKRDGAPLPDWDHIRLVGREVRVLFDSDAAHKTDVKRALLALSVYLRGRMYGA
jgi:putative DNA primase/helicase